MTITRKARSLAVTAVLLLGMFQGTAQGKEPWLASFQDTCAKSSEAMTLSVKELEALLERCAALQKVISAEEASVRKVYLKRLQLCSNLYAYVLDYKKNAQPSQ